MVGRTPCGRRAVNVGKGLVASYATTSDARQQDSRAWPSCVSVQVKFCVGPWACLRSPQLEAGWNWFDFRGPVWWRQHTTRQPKEESVEFG